eukprot:5313156-Pyramimonas_sp.AAC.1
MSSASAPFLANVTRSSAASSMRTEIWRAIWLSSTSNTSTGGPGSGPTASGPGGAASHSCRLCTVSGLVTCRGDQSREGREDTCREDQSREGREKIPAGGTSHVRGERIYHAVQARLVEPLRRPPRGGHAHQQRARAVCHLAHAQDLLGGDSQVGQLGVDQHVRGGAVLERLQRLVGGGHQRH